MGNQTLHIRQLLFICKDIYLSFLKVMAKLNQDFETSTGQQQFETKSLRHLQYNSNVEPKLWDIYRTRKIAVKILSLYDNTQHIMRHHWLFEETFTVPKSQKIMKLIIEKLTRQLIRWWKCGKKKTIKKTSNWSIWYIGGTGN